MNYFVVCIGNREGGDDAIGPFIADILKKKSLDDMNVLDVGIAPENFTGVVKKKNSDIVLLIDAIDMNLKAGDIRQVPKQQIGVMHVSTHGIPLSILMNYLEQYIKRVILIGIQPKQLKGSLSEEVKAAGIRLADYIIMKKIEQIPIL